MTGPTTRAGSEGESATTTAWHQVLPDLFVMPDFDGGAVEVTFTTPVDLEDLQWRISDHTRDFASGRLDLPSAGETARFRVRMEGFVPWSPDNPFLYHLHLSLRLADREVDLSLPFGMRKFHAEGNLIYLNNRPLYIRGVVRGREAHDHPNLLGLPEEEFYAKFIRQAKRFGFNFIRFHSKVPPEAYFRAADRLGMLTHIEVRKYYGKYQAERELMDHQPVLVPEEQWVNTILRLRNHPSLMVYCLGNEIDRPGRNPEVAERAAQLRRLDPTRLFIDTCARGEFDRTGIDLDVQHMGYFAPFGRHYRMFETTENWAIFGSARGREMVSTSPRARTRREVRASVPVIAHEVCHYLVLRDLDRLKRKFARSRAQEPWWIDELVKLRRTKGLEPHYHQLLAASQHFQFIWHKQVLESIRRSPILAGFHFLQLADTERYENANGLLDCFDETKPGIRPQRYLPFNADAVILADLPRRTFFEGGRVEIPVWLSNFAEGVEGRGLLSWRLRAKDDQHPFPPLGGRLREVDLPPGLSRLATIEVELPEVERPLALELTLSLKPHRGPALRNGWDLWLYPDRPQDLPLRRACASLRTFNPTRRYPRLDIAPWREGRARLLIADRFTNAVLRHLERGGDVLLTYRIPETRDRSAPPYGASPTTG